MTVDYTDTVLDAWQAVRPDVDASTAAVINRVTRLARHIDTDLSAVIARHGLGRKGDFDTLAALRRSGEPYALSPTQLAAAALITTGGMTARLDRLEKAGWVERRPDPADRRGIMVHLTEEGRRQVDDVLEANLARQRMLLQSLSHDRQVQLADLLRDLLIGIGDI